MTTGDIDWGPCVYVSVIEGVYLIESNHIVKMKTVPCPVAHRTGANCPVCWGTMEVGE